MSILDKKSTGLKKSHAITLGLVLYDFFAILGVFLLSLWVSYSCDKGQIRPGCLDSYRIYIAYYAWFSIFIYWRCRLYNSVWRFVSYYELFACFIGTCLAVSIYWGFNNLFGIYFPRRYYAMGVILQFGVIFASRISYRLYRMLQCKIKASSMITSASKRGIIVGAGAAGQMILRDIVTSGRTDVKISCIIDDDQNKWGQFLEGVPIIGGRDKIDEAVQKYHIDVIFTAIPTLSAKEKKILLELCKETGCRVMTLPGMYQIVNEEVSLSNMREITVEDLLGREPVNIDSEEILAQLSGKVILVTGGGGSIGSELCRQIAGHNPKQLIIFDLYENNAYDIEQELKMTCPDLNLLTLIGSVRDSRRIDHVFATYQPEIVFHAAAHKHVPLMELSPCEAIKNNVVGTYKTAFAAIAHGCRRFVLISTDKAVNPTNIMGASKRLCEMVIQTMDKVTRSGNLQCLPHLHSHDHRDAVPMPPQPDPSLPPTEFVAVRFGNVLGSNGSVIPLFKKQIAAGGPVTVTHPEIIRYFMTIPEAVSLVLQAATYAQGGEIFVLDMGAPTKIDTLARNLIKLSGYKPDLDIKIKYVGLRPGEKLYEEKLMDAEGLRTTPNKLIHIANPIQMDENLFLQHLHQLAHVAYTNDTEVFKLVEELVPTFKRDQNK